MPAVRHDYTLWVSGRRTKSGSLAVVWGALRTLMKPRIAYAEKYEPENLPIIRQAVADLDAMTDARWTGNMLFEVPVNGHTVRIEVKRG
jgi:hypothetical protein